MIYDETATSHQQQGSSLTYSFTCCYSLGLCRFQPGPLT
jgi:hypothetical protein